MPLGIVRNDITKMKVDAIVNAANTDLLMGGGVCGAIFSAAGAGELQAACDKLAPIRTGDAVITKGFSLPAKYVVHTAGPVYRGGGSGEEELLRSCYMKSLDLARDNGCESIAFPLISSGIYGYPKDEALSVATSAIGRWLSENDDMDVSLVVFDKTAFKLSRELQGSVQSFIDEHYVDKREAIRRVPDGAINATMGISEAMPELWPDNKKGAQAPASIPYKEEQTVAPSEQKDGSQASTVFTASRTAAPMPLSQRAPAKARRDESDYSAKQANFDYSRMRLDEPFSTTLLRIIEQKGKSDVEVYKRANIDRKLFSKIRSGKGYMPSKKTVLALAIALELSLADTDDLLRRAGFTLSRSVVFDVIVEFFIRRVKYDVFEINNVLFEYDQPLLGGI